MAAVPTGWEAVFLAEHSVTALPLDAATLRRLDLLGLHTIGAIAVLPLDALQAQFGSVGVRLHRLAHGLDDQPIGLTPEVPQLSRTRRFAGALLNRRLLEQAIATLAARLAADLEAGGWSARAVVLTLVLEDGAPLSLDRLLVEATADRTLLAQALLALSGAAALSSGVESVTVAATDLAPTVTAQLELFAPQAGQADRLRDVLGRLGARHAGSLLRAALVDPAARLPECRVRFEPLEPR